MRSQKAGYASWPLARKERTAYYGTHCYRTPCVTTVAVDAYILDTLMVDLVGHDRQIAAYLVYLFLWRHTHGKSRPRLSIALRDIAEQTGLSKRGVQDALRWLQRRKLITTERESVTAVPWYTVHRPWRR